MVGADDDDALVLNSWHEWEIEGVDRRIILCIETPLELRPGHDGFEPARLDALLERAAKLGRASPSPIDRIRIVQAEPN